MFHDRVSSGSQCALHGVPVAIKLSSKVHMLHLSVILSAWGVGGLLWFREPGSLGGRTCMAGTHTGARAMVPKQSYAGPASSRLKIAVPVGTGSKSLALIGLLRMQSPVLLSYAHAPHCQRVFLPAFLTALPRDRWGSSPDQKKSHDLQYWAPLAFDDSVVPPTLRPFHFVDGFELQLEES